MQKRNAGTDNPDKIVRRTGDELSAKSAREEMFDRLFNEPESEEVGKFLRMAGISDRNWRIFLRRYGRDEWTFAQIAEEFHIARPRAFQIVKRTEGLFAKGCEALRLGNAGKILNRMRRM